MLTLKNVNAGYGDFQALFDVSLDVRAGEAVAVIGPMPGIVAIGVY